MSYSNPSPPPTTTTTSQSDSKTQISHEISLENLSPATLPHATLQLINQLFQKTKDELFQKAMQEDWEAVISIYKDKRDIVSTAKITRNKETALHIAISDSKTEVAKELLNIIDPIMIREMVNDMDENPLHLAASLGQVETCTKLVEMDPELIGARNKEGETPLFQAALHGKEEAFYALHPQCPITGKDIKHDVVHCKRTDGNSILHVAIQGEYFGLAYQIIYWYPELIKFYNEKGLTALHILAQNPSAFRSGSHLGPFDDFIYRCLIVDSHEVETPSHFRDEHRLDFDFKVPGNYQTCLDLLNLWKYIFTTIATWARKWEDIKHDIRKSFNKDVEKQLPMSTGKDEKQATKEASQDKKCEHSDHIDIKVGDEMKKGSQEEEKDSTEQPQYPSNYNVFFNFVEFAMEFFLFVLGLGYSQVHKIKAMKQKHKLACQIMKKLVHNTEFWVYMRSGALAPITVDSSIVADSLLTELPVDASKHSTEGTEPTVYASKHSTKDTTKMMKDIISALPGTEVLVEAEKMRPDVYRLKMLKNDSQEDGKRRERSPVLFAVKMGVKEMVEEILNKFPVAIRDEDTDKKNVVLLAVENRHWKIYELLLNKYYKSNKSVFRKVDKDGNTAIHLAATFGKNRPWQISSAAIQMQWDLKWYNFIKSFTPTNLRTLRNKEGKSSMEVFEETHEGIIKDGVKWLNSTSASCSVVAALIASVAYASATTVPGGDNQYNGIPILKGDPSFDTFIIASLVALCFSLTSLTMFLSVITSNYLIEDFLYNLPTKLLLGLTSLFISIGAMLVSFCAGHFFNIGDQNRNTGLPVFAIICLPVSAYALTHFHLLISLVNAPFETNSNRVAML